MKQRLASLLRGIVPVPACRSDKALLLQATNLALRMREKSRIPALASVEFSAFSQWGEDGIIDWLISRLPDIPQTFIEFGVEDYREANTRLLLLLRNWRGFIMDGSEAHIRSIRAQDIYWRYDLTAKCAFIDRDNINALIASTGLNGDIGLLSIDIDGNDYWVWQAVATVSPIIVVCEFNAVFGDLHSITVPYHADFNRTRAHYSNLYFGASLPALVDLGQQKGYRFVGTNSNGCNAFFVRQDYANEIVAALDEVRAYPSRFREARGADGQLTFMRGSERADVIGHLPVVDIVADQLRPLAELGDLYSSSWLSV